jgi:hypothetical protein
MDTNGEHGHVAAPWCFFATVRSANFGGAEYPKCKAFMLERFAIRLHRINRSKFLVYRDFLTIK